MPNRWQKNRTRRSAAAEPAETPSAPAPSQAPSPAPIAAEIAPAIATPSDGGERAHLPLMPSSAIGDTADSAGIGTILADRPLPTREPTTARGGQSRRESGNGSTHITLQDPHDISGLQLWEGGARDYSEEYYRNKQLIFDTLVDNIDLTQLSDLDEETARNELHGIVNQIIAVRNLVLSVTEQQILFEDICSDVLGYGPLDNLLADDDISDIMVNGANATFVEINGIMHRTRVRFRDDRQLMNICQRIVSQVGRRIDEASPICDARLPDGSRVNVIAPPLSLDGPALTIRKFRRDRLTLEDLRRFGTVSSQMSAVLQIIGRVRSNILVSGGTGSGKTTLLNCLTGCIDHSERIVTCEDAAELQLQQPHVVRLETRPPNLEGLGAVTMRDLVRNCLRMRPERIIVGEVRSAEAFDLLQAMNTGHDGSMGTLHANNPREVLTRLEGMIIMGGFQLPPKIIREMIAASIDVIVHLSRLRDGARRVTHITEVVGMDGDTIILQDLFLHKIHGEDQKGRIVGRHFGNNILRPAMFERARYYNCHEELVAALESAPTEEDIASRQSGLSPV